MEIQGPRHLAAFFNFLRRCKNGYTYFLHFQTPFSLEMSVQQNSFSVTWALERIFQPKDLFLKLLLRTSFFFEQVLPVTESLKHQNKNDFLCEGACFNDVTNWGCKGEDMTTCNCDIEL